MENDIEYQSSGVESAASESDAAASSGKSYDELVGSTIQTTDYQTVVLNRLDQLNFVCTLIAALLFFNFFVVTVVTRKGDKR